ncbi:MAG: ATP-binding cassette protein [Ornithinibacter sp.]|nr:ATP-binding cassette protein [Ornithinibacter sp.]
MTSTRPSSWGTRGYRALQFQETPRLPLRSEPTIVLGEQPTEPYAGWLLVVDDDRRPVGWVEPYRIGARRVATGDLHRGGTVATEHGSLRAALDAALSSPSGRGVVVDGSGSLCGTVAASEVLTAIEGARRPERREGPA